MHLKSLKILNFRSLEDFEVSNLARVNLIVGKNNSGKSSVLEALRIYAAAAAPSLLEEIAAGHDERYRLTDSEWLKDPIDLPYENFFTGREFPRLDKVAILIGENEDLINPKNLFMEHHCIKVTEEVTEENGESIVR